MSYLEDLGQHRRERHSSTVKNLYTRVADNMKRLWRYSTGHSLSEEIEDPKGQDEVRMGMTSYSLLEVTIVGICLKGGFYEGVGIALALCEAGKALIWIPAKKGIYAGEYSMPREGLLSPEPAGQNPNGSSPACVEEVVLR